MNIYSLFSIFAISLAALTYLFINTTFISFILIISLSAIFIIMISQMTLITTMFSINVFMGYLMPYMIVRLGLYSELMEANSSRILATEDSTMIYITVFFSILTATYFLLKKIFKNTEPYKIFSLRYADISFQNTLLLPFFFLVVISADYFLYQNGMFIMVAQEATYFGPFASIIKVISGLKWILMLYCGYLFKTDKVNKFIVVFYFFLLLPYALMTGIISGSRGQLLYPILILIFSHFSFFKKFVPLMIPALPVVFLIFPILGNYRGMENPNLVAAFNMVIEDLDIFSNFIIVALDRLTQLGAINVAFSGINSLPVYEYRADYLFNIIGLIPRLIWPSKPSPLDTNEFGVQVGVLDPNNYNTSIGFDVVGESFIQIGYFGLIIAIFQASIFWFLNYKIDRKVASGFMIYFTLGFIATTQGTYINIIPTLLNNAIILLPLLFLFNKRRQVK